MEINTLVTHRRYRKIGIGCIAKQLGNGKFQVNFGTEMVSTCRPEMLKKVDISGCKTMTFDEFRHKTFCNNVSPDESLVIIGNELKNYVGIGWVTERAITHEDLTKYPRII